MAAGRLCGLLLVLVALVAPSMAMVMPAMPSSPTTVQRSRGTVLSEAAVSIANAAHALGCRCGACGTAAARALGCACLLCSAAPGGGCSSCSVCASHGPIYAGRCERA